MARVTSDGVRRASRGRNGAPAGWQRGPSSILAGGSPGRLDDRGHRGPPRRRAGRAAAAPRRRRRADARWSRPRPCRSRTVRAATAALARRPGRRARGHQRRRAPLLARDGVDLGPRRGRSLDALRTADGASPGGPRPGRARRRGRRRGLAGAVGDDGRGARRSSWRAGVAGRRIGVQLHGGDLDVVRRRAPRPGRGGRGRARLPGAAATGQPAGRRAPGSGLVARGELDAVTCTSAAAVGALARGRRAGRGPASRRRQRRLRRAR